MASTNTAALLKVVYGALSNPVAPEGSFARDIKFVPPKEQTGLTYTFPVRLGLEQGTTYSTSHDVVALNPAVDGVYQDATLQGAEIHIRSQLSYGEMSRLSAAEGNSAKAYDQGVALKIANMTQGIELQREMNLWYGAGSAGLANIGVISAIQTAASGGVVTINISRASFIPGFWQDFANGKVDVYSGGTLRNTNAALSVTGVDVKNARVQLTGNVSDAAALQAADTIFFFGARANSMVGVQAIAENTGSLFGISATTYPQWKVASYDVAGTLSFDKVAEGLSIAADNGLTTGCTLYLSNRAWTDLLTDEVALRRYLGDSGSKKAKPGFNELAFVMQCGEVKIKPYRYMKQSLAFAIPTDEYSRVGSTDVTATLPGNPEEFMFHQIDGSSGSELRMYTDQAIISEIPYHTVAFSGIESSADSIPG